MGHITKKLYVIMSNAYSSMIISNDKTYFYNIPYPKKIFVLFGKVTLINMEVNDAPHVCITL